MLKTRHNTYKVASVGVVAFALSFYLVDLLKKGMGFNTIVQVCVVICIGGLIAYIVASLTIGRDAVVVEQPGDYPPEGLSPIQAGLIIDGILNERDVTSVFFYLAQKGYMRIREYNHKEFEFIYRSTPEKEVNAVKLLFNAIFNDQKSIAEYKKAQQDFNAGKITEEELVSKEYVVALVDRDGVTGADHRIIPAMPKIRTAAFNSIDSKKNKEIADLTGKLLGFKTSVMTTKGEEAISLVEENRDYIFEIFPYAYALSITSKIPKKFEGTVEFTVPEWYLPYGVEPGASVDVVLYNAIVRNLPEQLHKEVFEFVFSRYANMIMK